MAECRGWEKEDSSKEGSRVREVIVQENVCVRCGSACTTSHHFNNIYVLFLDVNQIEVEFVIKG